MRHVMLKALTAACCLAAGNALAVDLTIVSWGGAYTASQQKAYHEPYMAANPDVRIINDDSGSQALARLRAQVETGTVTWDLIAMGAADAIIACDEGLIEPVDPDAWLAPAPDGAPASKDFLAGSLTPGGSNCFVPMIVYSTTVGYRLDAFQGRRPSSIRDLFDLEKFPGKRGLEKIPVVNLEWALIADGVPLADVYKQLATPEGMDRAFAKLDTIKDHVIWWTDGAQPAQLLADREVVMSSAYNGRLFAAIAERKQPFAILWDSQAYDLEGWVVPKGTKRLAAVKPYVRFSSDTRRQADLTKYIPYGPARRSSSAMIGRHATLGIDMKPHLPTHPDNSKNVLHLDYIWWSDHKTELEERFSTWLAK